MVKPRVQVSLDETTFREVQRIAAHYGISYSAAIVMVVRVGLPKFKPLPPIPPSMPVGGGDG